MSRFNRYSHRCDYCGRFVPWTWMFRWNFFAAYPKAWCARDACWQSARDEVPW